MSIKEINEEGVVEDVTNDVDSDDEENDAEGENVAGESQARGKGRQNRSEKKARKAISKLGMKPFPGVKRVTIKKNKDILFIVAQPDVLKNPSSDTYVIFGEAKVEDLTQQAAAQAARQISQQSEAAPAAVEADGATPAIVEDDSAEVEGIKPKDIQLVMEQASCTREEAVEAILANDGDIINSIMSFSDDQ